MAVPVLVLSLFEVVVPIVEMAVSALIVTAVQRLGANVLFVRSVGGVGCNCGSNIVLFGMLKWLVARRQCGCVSGALEALRRRQQQQVEVGGIAAAPKAVEVDGCFGGVGGVGGVDVPGCR